MDLTVQLPIALALSLLFITAAAHKLRSGKRFEGTLATYDLLPRKWVAPAARSLSVVELVVGMSLLVPSLWGISGPCAAGLLALYGLAISINLIRGRKHIDCGCGDRPQPLSALLVLRNVVLMAGSLALAAPTASRTIGFFDFVIVAMAFSALTLLYVTFEQLHGSLTRTREWSKHS